MGLKERLRTPPQSILQSIRRPKRASDVLRKASYQSKFTNNGEPDLFESVEEREHFLALPTYFLLWPNRLSVFCFPLV